MKNNLLIMFVVSMFLTACVGRIQAPTTDELQVSANSRSITSAVNAVLSDSTGVYDAEDIERIVQKAVLVDPLPGYEETYQGTVSALAGLVMGLMPDGERFTLESLATLRGQVCSAAQRARGEFVTNEEVLWANQLCAVLNK